MRKARSTCPNSQRALNHYFSPGNLTALRELALRRTAQRVDEQLLTHMRAHAIEGPWPAGERVLVCVSEDLRAAGSSATLSASPTGCALHGPRFISRRRTATTFR